MRDLQSRFHFGAHQVMNAVIEQNRRGYQASHRQKCEGKRIGSGIGEMQETISAPLRPGSTPCIAICIIEK